MFSGVQPTGNLHLGNYLGAIKNWIKLQEKSDCIFCIVDLHALTVPENCKQIKENSLDIAAAYIASGINPKKSIIFNQSSVSGHSELAWLLSCHTPIGWLNRMTQFKDKAGKNKEKAPLGLYSYPILMAADILLYKSTNVPVGDDQKQHLELCRNIAQSFNRHYKVNFFPIPDPIITGNATRVMSLRNGENKMSKSDPS
ncbi:MAG: tryptophan--tRNA ligase, partial [Rickettsiales bacterium]|nr:tryptophan--tRNA ligase [Rickettsiales bacterium]